MEPSIRNRLRMIELLCSLTHFCSSPSVLLTPSPLFLPSFLPCFLPSFLPCFLASFLQRQFLCWAQIGNIGSVPLAPLGYVSIICCGRRCFNPPNQWTNQHRCPPFPYFLISQSRAGINRMENQPPVQLAPSDHRWRCRRIPHKPENRSGEQWRHRRAQYRR